VRRDRAEALLAEVARGTLTPAAALEALAVAPLEAVGDAAAPFATIDQHRALRQGLPEVVYGEGKTPAQCIAIVERIAAGGDGFLVTRADEAARAALAARFPDAVVRDAARTVRLAPRVPLPAVEGHVCVVTAGTSDLPVADECAETLLAFGVEARRITDVGVAGLHRLLARAPELASAAVIVVVAGMDGALPSVVGGLVAGPVIACPTSVGYGAALGGLAPLLTMLNSCAAGVTVVNVDNGFGAAVAAARIVRARREVAPRKSLPDNGVEQLTSRAAGAAGD
jgi:NCAIR mutase (PurE)-related protein